MGKQVRQLVGLGKEDDDGDWQGGEVLLVLEILVDGDQRIELTSGKP